MARKKTQETKKEVVKEVIKEEVKEKKVITTKPTPMFNIKASSDVKLRKYPNLKDTSENIQGKMLAGKTYRVIAIIDYTPIKMYKLDNGYYVIADQNIKII